MLTLNVILNLASGSRNIGTIQMREKRFAKLSAFDDHVDKPMNQMLLDSEISDLREQNADGFKANREGEPDASIPFTEDESVTLELA